jgi:hypothetical protein
MKNAIYLYAGYFRRLLTVILCLVSLSLYYSSDSRAGEFHNDLSLQGFTGLFNTPNAEVTDEGKFYALYSNQRESQFLIRDAREDNYLFSVGLFSFLELGGRLTDAPNITPGVDLTHLTANFKVKVPFIPKGYYLPDLAFGMQDVAGGSTVKLQTKYAVATEELWRFRFSVGYGTGPDRMKGAFGGAEIKAFDWLYLIGENDTRETNVGARLVTPVFFGIPVNLQVTAKTSLSYKPGNFEFGFGLQFPLGLDHNNNTPVPERKGHEEPSPAVFEPAHVPIPDQTARQSDNGAPKHSDVGMIEERNPGGEARAGLSKLLEKLVKEGFQNVRVGTKDNQLLVVEYENSRYMHNELDGVGVVAGIVVDTISTGYEKLCLIMKKQGIRILSISAPLKYFDLFLHDASMLDEFNDSLWITTDIQNDEDVEYIDGYSHPSWLRSSLILYPGLTTFVGTEVGVFDYLLSLKLDYYLNIWKGAVVNARWDIPFSWSKNFDDGGAFRDYRNSSRIERAMLFQAIKIAPDLMLNLGGGMVLHDAYGTLNEAMWTPGNGAHQFMLKQAYVSSKDSQHQIQRNEVYLGSYRFYFNPLDLYLTGTGGKFFDNDKGFNIELKRFFGDTAFSVYYTNSRTTAHENDQVGGVQVAFPLTPRQEMKPYPLQLKGYDEWSYAQEVKIVSPGSVNSVNTSVGVNPQPAYNLEHIFYNRDRLTEMYIRKHLLRLRDAYITYRNNAGLWSRLADFGQ